MSIMIRLRRICPLEYLFHWRFTTGRETYGRSSDRRQLHGEERKSNQIRNQSSQLSSGTIVRFTTYISALMILSFFFPKDFDYNLSFLFFYGEIFILMIILSLEYV